jgi:DNA mismatch endonuclease (patch repair protein)
MKIGAEPDVCSQVCGQKMTDIFSPSKRSEVMSRIKGKGNLSTEMRLVRLFREHGITGWRRHLSVSLKGTASSRRLLRVKPDFVFRTERVVVFVDGCFWHGCPRCYQKPKQNAKFWREKIGGNQARDRRVTRQLRALGWSVCRIWECRLKKQPEVSVRRILRMLG